MPDPSLGSADAAPAATVDTDNLNALLASTPNRISFKDTEGRYLRVSRAAAESLGLADPAAALGQTGSAFLTAAYAAAVVAAEQEVLRSGQPLLSTEEKAAYRDGRCEWLHISRLPLRDRQGRLVGTLTIAHDITVRREAEEALRESEALFRSIFESSNDAIVLYLDDRFFDCNPRTLTMFNCAKEELVGLTPAAVSPPRQPDGRESGPAAAEHIATAYRQASCRFDWVHRRLDGTDFPCEVQLAAFDFGGRRVLQATIRDVTARLRAERERREMELQLQLGQKLESVGRLAAGVAHEINTPAQFVADNLRFLAAAFGQHERMLAAYRAALARATAAPPDASLWAEVHRAEEENEVAFLGTEIPRTLEQSIEGLDRITKIVGSLKEFSHPGGREMSGANLNRAIETAVAVSRHEWKYVATLATEFAADLPPVPCVLDEFNQAILNLIINAAHAIAEANTRLGRTLGRIVIRTRYEPGWALVEV